MFTLWSNLGKILGAGSGDFYLLQLIKISNCTKLIRFLKSYKNLFFFKFR